MQSSAPLGQPITQSTPAPKRTIVYIDSFNFYFGILRRKQPGYKWLDLQSWCSKLLPPANYDVQRIKFFTAKVSGKYDASKPVRQDIYFRALRTIPIIEMIFGTFLFKKAKIHITQEVDVTGMVPEEKGTDVNLAVHLLNDAHKGLFDTAVIVSNDSDLAEVVRIVTQELHLEVGIINPSPNPFSATLGRHATFKKRARDGQILNSQFATSLTDAVGMFTKPPSW